MRSWERNIVASNISSTPWFLSSPSGNPISCMLHLLLVSHSFWIFFSNFVLFCFVFLFAFHFGDSIDISSSSDSFLSCVQSTNESIKGIFHLLLVFLISSISLPFLKFPSLSFHFSSALVCLLIPLEILAY